MKTERIHGDSLTILLVEDNAAHAELVKRSLEDHRLANRIHHANSYLVKPVDFARFTRLMDELDFYWLGLNRSPWG